MYAWQCRDLSFILILFWMLHNTERHTLPKVIQYTKFNALHITMCHKYVGVY